MLFEHRGELLEPPAEARALARGVSEQAFRMDAAGLAVNLV